MSHDSHIGWTSLRGAGHDHFILTSDPRSFHVKTGHLQEDGRKSRFIRIKRGKKKEGAPPRPDLPLLSDGKKPPYVDYLQRHLSLAAWNDWRRHRSRWPFPDYQWLGTYEGESTGYVALDIDNHSGGTKNLDDRGRRIVVADLPLYYLGQVARRYRRAEATGKLPDVIHTSSRSLGLRFVHTITSPAPTEAAWTWAGNQYGHDTERYPMPMRGRHPEGHKPRCTRLPFGFGCVTLLDGGTIGEWHRQVDNWLDPAPIPDLPGLISHLLELWLGQWSAYWSRKGTPLGDRRHVEEHAEAIREWLAAGCPFEGGAAQPVVPIDQTHPDEDEGTQAPQPSDPVVLPTTAPSPEGTNRLPDHLRCLPIEQQVYTLATQGVPAPGCLNACLYVLAKHLLSIELVGVDDAEGITLSILGRWCMTGHNGHSSRLDGGELSPRQLSCLERIVGAAARKLSHHPVKPRQYSRPLRVRSIITGEGPTNLYSPPVGASSHNYPLLPMGSVYCVSDSDDTPGSPIDPVHCLSEPTVERIRQRAGRKPGGAIEFLTKFCNLLGQYGGRTQVSRDYYMPRLLGYRNPSQWARFLKIGTDAGLFRVSAPPVRGHRQLGLPGQSTEYELLLDEAMGSKQEAQEAATALQTINVGS